MMTYYFLRQSYIWRARSAGVKTCERFRFFEFSCENHSFSYDTTIILPCLSSMMSATAPDGSPPRRIGYEKSWRKNLPARRASVKPNGGFHHKNSDLVILFILAAPGSKNPVYKDEAVFQLFLCEPISTFGHSYFESCPGSRLSGLKNRDFRNSQDL